MSEATTLREIEQSIRDLASRIEVGMAKLEDIAITVHKHNEWLEGTKDDFGIQHKVRVMWSLHMWILCTASAAIGSGFTVLVMWAATRFTQS